MIVLFSLPFFPFSLSSCLIVAFFCLPLFLSQLSALPLFVFVVFSISVSIPPAPQPPLLVVVFVVVVYRLQREPGRGGREEK